MLLGLAVLLQAAGQSSAKPTNRWVEYASRALARYSRGTTIAMVGLTIFCSLTVFSEHGREGMGRLEVQVKRIDEHVKNFGRELANTLERHVRSKLLEHALQRPDPALQASLKQYGERQAAERALSDRKARAKASLGLDIGQTEEALRKNSERDTEQRSRFADGELRISPERQQWVEAISELQVAKARAQRDRDPPNRAIEVELSGTRFEVTSQVVEVLIAPGSQPVLDTIAASVPWLMPVAQALNEAVVNLAARTVHEGPLLARMREMLGAVGPDGSESSNPGNATSTVPAIADTLIEQSSAKIELGPEAVEGLQAASVTLSAQTADLLRLSAQIDQEIASEESRLEGDRKALLKVFSKYLDGFPATRNIDQTSLQEAAAEITRKRADEQVSKALVEELRKDVETLEKGQLPEVVKASAERRSAERVRKSFKRVEVWGRPGCSRTAQMLKILKDKGIPYTYHNIDKGPRPVGAIGDLLPFVSIDGLFVDAENVYSAPLGYCKR